MLGRVGGLHGLQTASCMDCKNYMYCKLRDREREKGERDR